ncbi:type IV pilin [Natronosalvus amylolyticus]|uniref:type IV pilin n=1 Tax=Natronosalvus amylolyticus TaxID=2961994 RepID=UPI002114FB01|nr:type IV pilin [Natronosalvus amylolyticus]
MDKRNRNSGRAIAPVIGVALLVGLAVLLSATIGVFAIEMAQSDPDTDFLETEQMGDETEPQTPDIDWEIERSGSFVTVTHAGGEAADASSVSVRIDGEEIDGFEGTIEAGDSTMEYAVGESTVKVIWVDGEGDGLVLEHATV